jgi:hypothetical protein
MNGIRSSARHAPSKTRWTIELEAEPLRLARLTMECYLSEFDGPTDNLQVVETDLARSVFFDAGSSIAEAATPVRQYRHQVCRPIFDNIINYVATRQAVAERDSGLGREHPARRSSQCFRQPRVGTKVSERKPIARGQPI